MKRLSTVFICLLLVAALSVTAFAANFTDVPSNAYYADAVNWAVSNGLISGTSSTKFSPDQGCTRAMFVTVLDRYRKYLDGGQILDVYSCPVGQEPTPFTDVNPGAWYYESVVWAYNNGIASGTSATLFSPNATLSRQDACLFVYRFAKMNDWHGTSTEDEINRGTAIFNNYTDKGQISSYAYDAMAWALEYGMISGTDPTTLAPRSTITRAQMVSFFYRLGCVASVHDYGAAQTVAPTCTKGGYDVRTCTKCGMKQYSNIVSALGHNYSSKKTDSKYFASAATCQVPASYYYSCSRCGAKGTSTFTSGSKIDHDYSKARLVSDATTSAPTKYRLVCSMCGLEGSTRSLGKKITKAPSISVPSSYNLLSWGSGTAPKSKVLYNGNGAKVTLTRKWFASAWCYIADIEVNKDTYKNFVGVSTYDGSRINAITAYNKVKNMSKAVLLVNGDAEMKDGNLWDNIRGNVAYGTRVQAYTSAPAHYWNPSNGTFGRVSDLSLGATPSISTLKSKGITDTIRWGKEWIKNGKFNPDDKDSIINGSDCDSSTYSSKNTRRQRTFMGFKKSGDTIHIYLVVSDGDAYTNACGNDYASCANDKASYGLIKREEEILMATLGCDYAFGLDGGGSSSMAIRQNGKVYQVNGVEDPGEKTARQVWDFFGFVAP